MEVEPRSNCEGNFYFMQTTFKKQSEIRNEFVRKAANCAIQAHDIDCNQRYGDRLLYSVHLEDVYNVGLEFRNFVYACFQSDVLAACWLHDTIEDARLSYNDIACEFGDATAEIVYALTNEKGRNRKERANDKYYAGIVATPFAAFVKMCDRIANVRYSKEHSPRMYAMYQKECNDFLVSIGMSLHPMGEYLKNLFL